MTENTSKPFSYYFKRRFIANKPAVFGLFFIVLCIIISVLGYTIMPDGTSNANNALPEIKKKSVGYVANVIYMNSKILVFLKLMIRIELDMYFVHF